VAGFGVSLTVSIVVSLLWTLCVHGGGVIDWETSFRFAIRFGIIVPWCGARSSKPEWPGVLRRDEPPGAWSA